MKHTTIILALIFLASCQEDKPTENNNNKEVAAQYNAKRNRAFWQKNAANPSEFFEIDPTKDTLLLSQQGTLLEIPKDNFLDANGKLITTPIQIEWQDIISLEDAMDNGLSTLDAQGNMLETGGMFYLDLSSKSTKDIQIKSPIRVEIQTSLAQPRLQQYEGQWKGDELVWNEPKALDKTMSLVDLDALYDKNGRPQLQGNNNFHEVNTVPQKILIQAPEPFVISSNCEVETLLSSVLENDSLDYKQERWSHIGQTWIATQEFQARYSCLLKACSVKGLELYIENTNLALWKVDKMVAELLEKEENAQASNFRKFAALKYTIARNNKPFSADLVRKIKENYKQNNNNKNFFSYPIMTLINKTGYLNMDCLFDIDPETTIIKKYKTKTKINNSPKNQELEVFLVFKGIKTLVTTNLAQNTYERNFGQIPLNLETLLVAKSKNNNYVGWKEVVIKGEFLQTEITMQVANEQGNYKNILNSYLDPDVKLKFTKEQEGKCCEIHDIRD